VALPCRGGLGVRNPVKLPRRRSIDEFGPQNLGPRGLGQTGRRRVAGTACLVKICFPRRGVSRRCIFRFGQLLIAALLAPIMYPSNQIGDLLNANLRTFVGKHLKLERVDHAAVGKLLAPKMARQREWPLNDPDYWARQAAFRALKFSWYDATDRCRKCSAAGPCGKHELALAVWQLSPAHVRGFLHRLRTGVRVRKRGRPRKHRPQARSKITTYQISRCFY